MPRTARALALIERRRKLEVYEEPMPLVVEVWSPSTGRKDTQLKLREYRSRGDQEIWFIHPRRRWLTVWRRQPDASYLETRYTSGVVQPASLPNVLVRLEQLFSAL